MAVHAGHFKQALFDGNSQLRKSQSYRVYEDEAATTLATIYTDETKDTEVTQPLTTSANGNADFYADAGDYWIKVGSGTPVSITVDENKADTAETVDLNAHIADTTSVHGITDTAALETATGAQTKADSAQAAAQSYADGLLVGATLVGTDSWLISNVNNVMYPDIDRDANDAVLVAEVVWPDGTPGTFTSDTLSEDFPGAVDAYHVTYEGDDTKTVTQPAVTRNVTGAVISQPELEVT